MTAPTRAMTASMASWWPMSALSAAMDRPVTTVSPVTSSVLTRTRYSPREPTLTVTGVAAGARPSSMA